MLSSATEKWEDRSDLTTFRFVFYCDCCGKVISSPEYPFQSGFPERDLTEGEQQARNLLWQRDHDAAYERANLYVLANHIHFCEVCGAHICGDCAVFCDELKGAVCCDTCLEEKGYHGVKL